MSSSTPATLEELGALTDSIDRWLAEQRTDNPAVAAVERDPGDVRRWFVRIVGEAKDAYTIRFHLRQRTLHYETFFMPAPAENVAELYAHLLRRNLGLYGASFALGEEDGIYLTGHLDRSLVVPDELDRVLGSIYAWVEQYFQPALRIGFASRFTSHVMPPRENDSTSG